MVKSRIVVTDKIRVTWKIERKMNLHERGIPTLKNSIYSSKLQTTY